MPHRETLNEVICKVETNAPTYMYRLDTLHDSPAVNFRLYKCVGKIMLGMKHCSLFAVSRTYRIYPVVFLRDWT